MQDCIAKYQSRDMHMRTAKSKAKCCRKPTGTRERRIFGKHGTNMTVTGSELFADTESFGV